MTATVSPGLVLPLRMPISKPVGRASVWDLKTSGRQVKKSLVRGWRVGEIAQFFEFGEWGRGFFGVGLIRMGCIYPVSGVDGFLLLVLGEPDFFG